jgi:hypothetical protein
VAYHARPEVPLQLPAEPGARPAREPARPAMTAVIVCGSVATVTGTFVFSYPETFAPIRGP